MRGRSHTGMHEKFQWSVLINTNCVSGICAAYQVLKETSTEIPYFCSFEKRMPTKVKQTMPLLALCAIP